MTKKALGAAIAAELGIAFDDPVRSQGTVMNGFLERVVESLGGEPRHVIRAYSHKNYDLLAYALQLCGMDFDPRAHTSAEAPTGGGGTITAVGLHQLLSGVQRFRGARYFIVNETDDAISAQYADEVGRSYGFDDRVSGRVALIQAGNDARLVFYRTSKSTSDPKTFVATAVVDDVVAIGAGRWTALLRDYRPLGSPVPRDAVHIEGWNNQISITEVCRATYDGVLRLGGAAVPVRSRHGLGSTELAELDLGPVPLDAPVFGEFAPAKATSEPQPIAALGSPRGDLVVAGNRWRGGTRASDKAAELRAVEITRLYLMRDGWHLVRDTQADGVGYDLEFERDGQQLLVEVKGIQGPFLRFNMTAREWQRAEAHPEFVVVAVTNVLKEDFEVHVLQQPDLFRANRVVTQYRVGIET